MRPTHDRLRRFALCTLVYLGLSAVWIYGVLDQGMLDGSDLRWWSALTVVGVAHVVLGYVAREWPAVLLPMAVLPLAVMAGYPESQFGEPAPVWLGQLVLCPFETLLIAAGLGLRAFVDWRRAGPAPSLPGSRSS